MSSIPLTPEQRAQKWGTIAKWLAIPAVGFVIAPYIFTAITGLIGLAIAGAILLGTWMVLPALESWAKNMRLKLIKAEAAKNPIETLESEHLRRTLLLNERSQKIERLAAKTQGFGAKLNGFKSRYPSEAQVYQEIYDKMTLLLKRSREQWRQADGQLKAFAGEIEKAKAKWEMALSAADLQQDAGTIEADFIARLKVETSLDAIQDGMNMAFAQLDTLLMESETVEINVTPAKAALPAPTSATAIDASELKTNVKTFAQ